MRQNILQITEFTYIKAEYPYLLCTSYSVPYVNLLCASTARLVGRRDEDQQPLDKVDPARTEQNSKKENINNNFNMS